MLPSLESAPLIKVPSDGEMHKVSCPYCLVGYTEVLTQVYRKNGEMTKQIEGMNEPKRCVTCRQFFMLKPKVVLVGVPIEEQGRKK